MWLCAPMWASASTEFYCFFINVGSGALDAPLYALSFLRAVVGAGPYGFISMIPFFSVGAESISARTANGCRSPSITDKDAVSLHGPSPYIICLYKFHVIAMAFMPVAIRIPLHIRLS